MCASAGGDLEQQRHVHINAAILGTSEARPLPPWTTGNLLGHQNKRRAIEKQGKDLLGEGSEKIVVSWRNQAVRRLGRPPTHRWYPRRRQDTVPPWPAWAGVSRVPRACGRASPAGTGTAGAKPRSARRLRGAPPPPCASALRGRGAWQC
jgi:hypothetical protein